jgi:TP901 family phage tail tape measure protein
MADINLNIGGNTTQLMRDIQKTVNRVYSINLKTKGEQPLGRITGQVNEFNKSLAASNARVIAFGASAGLIFGVQRAFSELARSTVEVQKSLQDINVILNVSSSQLQKFGGELFNIAKNTGQSFNAVAEAATEFSRQGLGVVETLKRTNEALILSRLSGLDTVKSVEALTAAVNSFASQAVTATEVVNKFANVDAAFAVSSADLAEALQRVGSSAAQSGVSLNELIAIVTSAQQTTARGGAVIGNSFKTIFTRLQRGKVINLLESLGVDTKGPSGEIKSTINLLQDLAKVYDQLGTLQQAEVAEKVGGVFQINILKSALADLGKEYSIYNSALEVAASSTDQAIRRNEELNKTYAAQLNALKENARQAGGTVGTRLFGPTFDRTVGNVNELLGGINESDGKGVGAVLAKGILDGLGQVLAGPGLVLIGGVLFKLFKDLAGFAAQSFRQLLGLNTASSQQRDLQQSINQILQKNPQLLELALKGEQGLASAAKILLDNLRAQTVELQKQATVSAQIAKTFYASGVRFSGGVPVAPTTGKTPRARSGGFIPNFSAQNEITGIKKSNDYNSSQKRNAVNNIKFAKFPGIGLSYYNGEESVVSSEQVAMAMGYPKGTKPKNPAEKYSILTPAMQENLGFAAQGFIPNFATDIFGAGRVFENAFGLAARIQKKYREDNNILDFEPSVLSTVDANVRKKLGLSTATNYGDAKLSDRQGNFASYISKIIRYDAGLRGTKGLGTIQNSKLPFKLKTRKNKSGNAINLSPPVGGAIILPGKPGAQSSDQPVTIRASLQELLASNKTLSSVFNNPRNKYGVQPGENPIFSTRVLLERTSIPLQGTFLEKGSTREDREKLSKKISSSYAKGFIPNFAQAKEQSTQLGNLDRIPNSLGNKVLSLIYPGLSEGYSLRPATATYLKKRYTGNIPVAGINEKKLKSQLPDLDKNIGDLLVKEANKFGQSLGGFKFLQSAQELPNYGAAKGAVGVAFEGGVSTLLQQKVGKQNAGIDFRNVTPRLRSIFNNAPGAYDAKSSANLTNEVLQKLLNETKPGATVQKRSGRAGKDYLEQRSAAVNQLRKEGITGSANINRALKDRFNIVGRAAGFIPNFAVAIQEAMAENAAKKRELEAGASSGQIRMGKSPDLKTRFNPEGKAIWSTKFESSLSEGIAMAEEAGIDPKTKGMSTASGFIPNFAEPAAPTQDVAGALGVQLASILPLLALTAQRGDEYAQSLQRITEENKQAGKVTGQFTKAQRDSLREQIRSKKITVDQARQQFQAAKYGPTTGQKVGARFGGGGSAAFAAATIAPILAETLKQGIDQSTKEGRVKGAVTSGLGQTAAFAATGFAVGGPVGAAVGAVAGAGLTLKGLLDQINTDLPELSAAAQKAAQDLTKFNDTAQKVITGFEQVKDLREGGQAQKAGELEAQLLKNISVDFAESPDLALKATTAVLNKDFKSLTEALNANSEILLKQKQEKERAESVTANVETLGKEGASNKIGREAAKALGLEFFRDVDVTKGTVETKNIDSLIEGFKKFEDYSAQVALATTVAPTMPGVPGGVPYQPFEITAERVTKEDLIESVKTSGLTEAQQEILEKLIKEQDSIDGAIAVLDSFKKNVEDANRVQASVARQTAQNNKIIKLIQEALSNVASNFNKLASLSSETLAIQSVFNQAKQEALSAIQVEDLSGRAELAETFGGQEQSRKLGIRAGRAKIGDEFDKDVASSLANVTDLIGQTLNQAIEQGISNIGSFGVGTEEEKAKQQLAEAQRLTESISSESIAREVAGIVNAEEFKTGAGLLDTNAIIEALKQSQNFAKLSPEDQTKALQQIRQEINKSNQTLQKAVVIQQQQLTILANQKLNQLIKELATAVINSFGGIEKFITGKALDNTIADDIKEILAEREGFRAAAGNSPDRDTITEYGRRAGRLLDAFTEVTGGRGGIFTEETGLVQQEIRGQANNIEDIFNAIRDAANAEGASASEREAFEITRRALIEQSGVQGEDLARAEAGDMRPVFEAIARIQSLERRKSGEISTGIRDNAIKKLAESDPELAKLLEFDKEGNLISGAALDNDTLLLAETQAQSKILNDILQALEQTGERVEVAEQAQTLQALEDSITKPAAAAGINLPGTEGITDAIFNNVPSLYDPNAPLNVTPPDTFEQPFQIMDPTTAFGPNVGPIQDAFLSPEFFNEIRELNPEESQLSDTELATRYLPTSALIEQGLPLLENLPTYGPITETEDTVRKVPEFEDIVSRLNLDNLPQYNVTPGLGVGINPTNETFEETSQLRDSIQEEVSAVNNLTTSITTLSEQLGRGNVEAGSNQNLAGGTFGDITVTPAAISVTVEGSLAQDKIAEIEKVLREQSDQNVTQVIAELNQKVARLEELGNNIAAQNPGVRPPPRGAGGAR